MRAQSFDKLVRVLHRLRHDDLITLAQSRRSAVRSLLAALTGIALTMPGRAVAADVPNHPGHRVLNRQTKRRQRHRAALKRRRRQRDKSPGDAKPNIRGISILLRNPATARSTPHIECVETQYLGVCTVLAVFDIAPGGPDRVFDTSDTATWCQINRRYSFEFINAVFQRPFITALINSSTDLCPAHVVEVLDRTPMDEGQTVSVTIEGHVFTIRRNDDKPDFKYFTLDLANTL